MGGSGSRSAQELHRSPPCTRFQCVQPARRQTRTVVGLPKSRQAPPRAPPQQQCREPPGQKSAPLRKGEVAVGRLRAGCESFQGYGDAAWPSTGGTAHHELARRRSLQRGDAPFLCKADTEVAQLAAVKQRVDKPAAVARPRSPRQPEARQGAAQSVGYVLERWPAAAWPPQPPPPPPEPPPPAAAAAAHAPRAAPRRRGCRDASASYAGSSTSSRSSLAPDDSGISSSPSRVSLQSHRDDCEGELFVKPRSPRPPAWKVRGFHEGQIPNDLHRRFCEEILSRYELQTEEDRRRRLLAIRRIDAVVSQRMSHSHGREIPPPHSSLQRGPKRLWAAGERGNIYQLRNSGSNEGRKTTHSGIDDIVAIRRRPLLDQYPNSYTDRLQQQVQADIDHYRSLNDAIVRQLREKNAHENSRDQSCISDVFSKKLSAKSDKDDTHKTNEYLKQMKSERTNSVKEDTPNVYGNARGEKESINRTLDPSEIQIMFSKNKRYGQNEKESTIVDDWYGEGLKRQEEDEPDNIILQAGQWVQNNIKDHGTKTRQSDSSNAALAQNCARSDTAGSALLSKDNMVMQLLLGGYFKHEHLQPCWPRVGTVRRTTNQLDVSIHSCSDPVEKQSVETQTLPVHVSRRLPHLDQPRVPLAPKIEIDHRGGLTRYYSLGRECSVGSLASTSGTPGSPRGTPTAGEARLPDEERRPSFLVQEMPPPPPPQPPPPPPPSCASQHSQSGLSPRGQGPNAQWISPVSAFISPHNNRYSSMPQPLASHMNGNSATQSRSRGLTLKPDPEVNNGSDRRNTLSKSAVARDSTDQSNEDYEAVESEQEEISPWNRQIVHMSRSTLHKPSVDEVRAETRHLFSDKKNNAESTNEMHLLSFSDRRPLASEENLGYTRVNKSNQYNHRVSLDDPPTDFSLVDEGRSLQHSTRNARGDLLHHSVECWEEEETKEKPEQGMEKTRRRLVHRHPRHSRHHRDSSRRAKNEEKFDESDSGSEERTVHRSVGLQSLRRVVEKTDVSISCRGKESFDTSDNVSLGNVRADGRSQSRHNAARMVEEKEKEETSDDSHLLIGSTEQSSDNITKSSTSVLCSYCREEAQAQCKIIHDRKKLDVRDSRRSVDQSTSWATQVKPSATLVRNADGRTKRESQYERNDSDGEDISHCRSSCCCKCHKPHGQPRFQPDVSGRQGTHVAKRSGTAPAADTPCCCRDQQSEQCGRRDGPLSDRRSFHECYCGSRRVCYSILEDEEEAAAAEEAQPRACALAHAHSCFRSRSAGQWSQ